MIILPIKSKLAAAKKQCFFCFFVLLCFLFLFLFLFFFFVFCFKLSLHLPSFKSPGFTNEYKFSVNKYQ